MFLSLGQLLVVLLQKTLMWEDSEGMSTQGGVHGLLEQHNTGAV